jgi:2-dehydro-3-deoxyphosphogluconate aldolase / (4S)-4-hydroxy-2-oxoglutarate aldolase
MNAPPWPPEPPLIAVIRVADASLISDEHLLALARHGLGVEVAMTCAGATALLGAASRLLAPTVLVGAGTVLSAADADAAHSAGAQFVTSPSLWPGLEERRTAVVPGVFTPRDVTDARTKGFTRLKLFPARPGPAYLRDLRAVFPDTAFWPSGGVSEANVGEWREAGAAGLFIGQSLVGSPTEPADAETLGRRAARIVAAWRESPPSRSSVT